MKKIIILTSYITGHGHKSITNSLEAELKQRENIDYKVVEGFGLGGKLGISIAKSYSPIVCKNKKVWKVVYKVSEKCSNSTDKITSILIKRRLNKLLDEYNPDLIITVHPVFNSSLMSILKKRDKKIPLITIFADLVSISSLWINKYATLSIVPTKEASVVAQKNGIEKEKIEVIKLPVRKEIVDIARNIQNIDEEQIKNKSDIKFLIMSGGEGAGNFEKILNDLLKIENSKISIITGNNAKLKEKIEQKYKENLDRIKVYGYVQDVGNLMVEHDIGIVRGSPNVLMECISCLLPVIVNGALPGQEEGNIDFILLNELGVFWNEGKELIDIVNLLIENGKKKMIEIKKKQLEYRNLDSAKQIIDKVETILEKNE